MPSSNLSADVALLRSLLSEHGGEHIQMFLQQTRWTEQTIEDKPLFIIQHPENEWSVAVQRADLPIAFSVALRIFMEDLNIDIDADSPENTVPHSIAPSIQKVFERIADT